MISVIEKWRPIEGYENYLVSDYGDVMRQYSNGKKKMLKGWYDKFGYHVINLCKNGKRKCCRIHRLVAQAFIPNPDNLPCVNHKDEVKTNNNVGNLEFCSIDYNNNYGTGQQRAIDIAKKKCCKKVSQYSLDGQFIREWDSASDAHREAGFKIGGISNCCLGKQKSHKGFIWHFS